MLVLVGMDVFAQQPGAALPLPTVTIGVQQTQSPREFTTALQILLVLTVLALAPSIVGDDDLLYPHRGGVLLHEAGTRHAGATTGTALSRAGAVSDVFRYAASPRSCKP